MTPAERAAIRRRWEAASGSESAEIAREHFPALLAALDAAERERDRQYDENVEQIAKRTALEAENARLRALLEDGIVLKPWVFTLPWRLQSTLFSALRGPDTSDGSAPAVAVMRWIRGVVQKDACAKDGTAHLCSYMLPEDAYPSRPTEPLPPHFVGHLESALRVIATYHPDEFVRAAALRAALAGPEGA